MFEAPEKEPLPESKAGLWIGVGVVVAIAIGLYFYFNSQSASSTSPAAANTAAASAAAAGPSDPAKDLRIVSATMDKDYTGTVAQWLVDIRNESQAYSYKDITYETTYSGANNSVLLVNQGKLNLALGPGEEQSTQFRDALYPAGTAVYRIRITGATATKQ